MLLTRNRALTAGIVGSLLSLAAPSQAVITFTETITDADIGRETLVFLFDEDPNDSNPPVLLAGGMDVLLGTYPTFPLPILSDAQEFAPGKPFNPVTADFSTDTSLAFRIVAPAGQHFLVHSDSLLEFNLHFQESGQTVTLVPHSALSLRLDGVEVPLDRALETGMDPDGKAFSFRGDVGIPAGTTFSELMITLDYTVDNGNQPLSVQPGTSTLTASDQSYLVFSTGGPTTSTDVDLNPVISVVPEPATAGIGGAMLLLALRRRPRRTGA